MLLSISINCLVRLWLRFEWFQAIFPLGWRRGVSNGSATSLACFLARTVLPDPAKAHRGFRGTGSRLDHLPSVESRAGLPRREAPRGLLPCLSVSLLHAQAHRSLSLPRRRRGLSRWAVAGFSWSFRLPRGLLRPGSRSVLTRGSPGCHEQDSLTTAREAANRKNISSAQSLLRDQHVDSLPREAQRWREMRR